MHIATQHLTLFPKLTSFRHSKGLNDDNDCCYEKNWNVSDSNAKGSWKNGRDFTHTHEDPKGIQAPFYMMSNKQCHSISENFNIWWSIIWTTTIKALTFHLYPLPLCWMPPITARIIPHYSPIYSLLCACPFHALMGFC